MMLDRDYLPLLGAEIMLGSNLTLFLGMKAGNHSMSYAIYL
jgi:hypothetical protein